MASTRIRRHVGAPRTRVYRALLDARSVATRFHPEILDPHQDEVLTSVGAAVAQRGYHLGEGTALALVFGHRTSVDFDRFSEAAMGDPMRLAGFSPRVVARA